MYMGPIKRGKPATSIVLKRAIGAPILLLSTLLMAPFLAAYALYAVTMLGITRLPKSPKILLDAIDYAGGAVLGR